jgi:hypothetical protein
MTDRTPEVASPARPAPTTFDGSSYQAGRTPATAAETKQATQELVDQKSLPSIVLTTTETAREAQRTVADPKSSEHDKLIAANEMATLGINHFKDSSGQQFDIATRAQNGSTHVEVSSTAANGDQRVVANGQLTDSELAATPAGTASPQQQRLLADMAAHGQDPGKPSEADRLSMLKKMAQTAASLDPKAIEQQVTADRLETQLRPTHVASIAADNAGYAAGDKLNADLKAAGLPEIDSRVPRQVQAATQAVKDAANLSPTDRTKLEGDFHDLATLSEAAAQAAQKEADGERDQRTAALGADHAADPVSSQDQRLLGTQFRTDLQAIDRLPEQQRAGVYSALERIANDQGDNPNHLNSDQRRQIIEQLAHQIANPDSISQGTKLTCTAGANEYLLAKDSPDKYASTVADLATKGETTLSDGMKMRIDSTAISTPQDDGSYAPAEDGSPARSLASKIFQTADMGATLQYRALREGTAPSLYVNSTPGSPRDLQALDTGEHEVRPDGSLALPQIYSQDDAKVLAGLTGHTYESVDLSSQSPQQREQSLLDLARHNGLPVQVIGHDGSTDHAMVITGINGGQPASVSIFDPQHEYPSDAPIPMSQLLDPNGSFQPTSILVRR